MDFPNLSNADVIAFDTETSGLDPHKDRPVGYVFTWSMNPRDSIYLPIRHEGGGNLDPEPVIRFARDTLARTDLRVVMHNAAFDIWMAEKDDVIIKGAVEDTGLNAPLIDENLGKYNLQACCERADKDIVNRLKAIDDRIAYVRTIIKNLGGKEGKNDLDPELELATLLTVKRSLVRVQSKRAEPMYEHLASKFGGKANRDQMSNYWRLPGDDPIAVEYAAGDGTSTLQLWNYQQVELDVQDLRRVWRVESDLVQVLARARKRGVPVDVDYLGEMKKNVADLFEKAMVEIGNVNPRAPSEFRPFVESVATHGKSDLIPASTPKAEREKQVFEMWDEKVIPLPPKTKPSKTHPNGQLSFNTKYLKKNEETAKIVRARKLAHMESLFVIPLTERHVHNGHVYPNFWQMAADDYGTVTGRLSGSDPNLQQVTKRDKELAKILRPVFVAPEGYTLCEMDYSQAEYRLFAHFARAEKLIKAYNEDGIDMHEMVSNLLGMPRDQAKNMNFGMLYGMGDNSLAGHIGVSKAEAKRLKATYFAEVPEAEVFMEAAAKVAEERGYVRTLLGRRRRYRNPKDMSYMAINSICQGGNADIIKIKMIEVDDYLRSSGRGHFAFSVHDALVMYLSNEFDVEETAREVGRICTNFTREEHGFELRVGMKMDQGFGKNWAEASFPELKQAA